MAEIPKKGDIMSIARKKTLRKGAMRMKDFGYKAVQLWFDGDELAMIRAAMPTNRSKLATWIRETVVNFARAHQQEGRP